MKKLFTLFFLFSVLHSYSQEPELLTNSWRLFGLQIDGVNYTPTSNEEVSLILLDFETDPNILYTNVCNSLFGDLVFGSYSFTFPDGISYTLIECENPDNSTFEGLYFGFFEDNVNNTFTYEVSHVDDPEWWYLIIYAENGDYAEYEWYFLANQDNQSIDFTLFPNPVKDNFSVTINNSAENVNLTVYNILGEIVLEEYNYQSNSSIGVSNLNSGIYFVSIKDEYGNVSVKKLIKK